MESAEHGGQNLLSVHENTQDENFNNTDCPRYRGSNGPNLQLMPLLMPLSSMTLRTSPVMLM